MDRLSYIELERPDPRPSGVNFHGPFRLIVQFEAGGCQVDIPKDAKAEDVAFALDNLAREVRKFVQPPPMRVNSFENPFKKK